MDGGSIPPGSTIQSNAFVMRCSAACGRSPHRAGGVGVERHPPDPENCLSRRTGFRATRMGRTTRRAKRDLEGGMPGGLGIA